jgi:hypothetical protein
MWISVRGRSAPVLVMKRFGEDEQLLSDGCTFSVGPPCFEPTSSSFTSKVAAATAGEVYPTTNLSTYPGRHGSFKHPSRSPR